jgi:hypothetical protein
MIGISLQGFKMTIGGYDKKSLNHGLILDLTYYEGTGLLTHDISPSRINMSVAASIVWSALPSGKIVLNYGGDHSGDFLQCPAVTAPGLDFTSGDFTLMAWTYSPAGASDSDMIMAKNQTSVDGWEFFVTNPTLRTISLRTNQAGAYTDIMAVGAVILDAWLLLAVTRSGAGGQFYVNGLPVATTLGAGLNNAVSPVARKFRIGTQYDEINNIFEGMMTNHKVWNRAISAVEVKRVFESERIWFGV